jgi:hypothetical protein
VAKAPVTCLTFHHIFQTLCFTFAIFTSHFTTVIKHVFNRQTLTRSVNPKGFSVRWTEWVGCESSTRRRPAARVARVARLEPSTPVVRLSLRARRWRAGAANLLRACRALRVSNLLRGRGSGLGARRNLFRERMLEYAVVCCRRPEYACRRHLPRRRTDKH